MLIFVFITFKWSLSDILFWKETFDEWNYFFFLKKTSAIILSDKSKQNFLPSNRNEDRTYSALKTERFRMMFNVWLSV